MEVQREELAVAVAAELVAAPAAMRKPNRGWFRPKDPRINLAGRPKDPAKDPPPEGHPGDRAEKPGRLKLLVVSRRWLASWLEQLKSPYVLNLPRDHRIISARLDGATDSLILHITSEEFETIPRGSLIPKFEPRFEGLLYLRR